MFIFIEIYVHIYKKGSRRNAPYLKNSKKIIIKKLKSSLNLEFKNIHKATLTTHLRNKPFIYFF